MKVTKEQLGNAIYEAIKEINNGARLAMDKGLTVLLPEAIDVQVEMIYTPNDINRIQTTVQAAAVDSSVDAPAIDTEVQDPSVDTEIGGAGTETTVTQERVDTETTGTGGASDSEIVETEVRKIAKRTTENYLSSQLQETESVSNWNQSGESLYYEDEDGNKISYYN